MKQPIEMKPKFNEKKATQAAVLLLKMNGGQMNYMKLVKLLYNIDREAMRRWARPVTYDDLFSMPHGLVVSKTLDKAENPKPKSISYWDMFIQTRGRDNCLIKDPGDDELSPAEEILIREMDERYKNKSQYDMRDEHHNPHLFPEYIDPEGSRIQLDYESLLRILGFPEEDITEVINEISELSILEQSMA